MPASSYVAGVGIWRDPRKSGPSLRCVLFRKLFVAMSDTFEAVSDTVTRHVTKEFEDRDYCYTYLADCASRCTFALTQDPDYAPLNSAESVAKFADDTFATFDAMHPGFKSYWDNPATEEEAKALKIPMPHSQPQSVFDGAPFGTAITLWLPSHF